MGCCGAVDNNIDDLPYGKIEEFNNLKSEIEEIITGKNNKDRKNANKLFDLFDRTSNKITEYEKEIKLIKNKKKKNNNINDNMIHELNNDIKQLKEYNHTLNDLLKESNEKEIEKIYFKKSIRRNKKSDILNKKSKLIPKVDYNIIENNQENELMGNNKNHVVNDENNLINIIFAIENGEKIDIQIEKDKKFMDAMEKLGEKKEEYNDIEKLEILDGNDEIIDKVKNGEIISSFGFDNNHIIQIKIKD